jgi:hypothetical protein
MKLCILVVASFGESYERYLRAWKNIQYPSWVTVKYVFHIFNLNNMLDVYGSDIYVRGYEVIRPGIFFKTRAAMEYLLKNEEFDYILRTNLTTFFNIELLEKFLQDKPTTNAMFGHYMFNAFLSGSGYCMTRDVAQRFIDWKYEEEINANALHDDQNVGLFMNSYSIPHYDWIMTPAYAGMSLENIHIRCSPNELPENGPDIFEELVARYNSHH